MCNLYKMTKARDEVARLFEAQLGLVGNAGGEVYPGYSGLVVANGELRSMTWGFPLVLRGKTGEPLEPKPVNNVRTDKLDSGFWRPSFIARRCLIPLTEFAEPEGERGARTRTWISFLDQGVFAVAGIWRDTAEWGPAYAMVVTEICAHLADIHDRMPVILRPDDWIDWLDGPPDAAGLLCRPFSDLMAVRRTYDPWVRR